MKYCEKDIWAVRTNSTICPACVKKEQLIIFPCQAASVALIKQDSCTIRHRLNILRSDKNATVPTARTQGPCQWNRSSSWRKRSEKAFDTKVTSQQSAEACTREELLSRRSKASHKLCFLLRVLCWHWHQNYIHAAYLEANAAYWIKGGSWQMRVCMGDEPSLFPCDYGHRQHGTVRLLTVLLHTCPQADGLYVCIRHSFVVRF